MPRIDLDDPDDIWVLGEEGVLLAEIVERDASVDVCIACWEWYDLSTDVSHPPYEDMEIMVYHCTICGVELGEEDN